MSSQNSFGKALASADKSVRDKAVKRLSKYLSHKKDLSDLDLLKLWKGLFYCFWMSDKPLVQQQLSENLASLVLKIPDEIALKFVEAFWKEIRLEWTGIDRLRLDKFYYLFRQMHLNSFKFLEKVNWDITHVIKYLDIYTDGPLSLLDQTVPPSLLYHASEVFISELEKAITKPIPTSVFTEMLEPFFDVIGFCSNDILVEKVVEELFLKIVNIFENEDANEVEESNIVKSCNFNSFYKRLEKLSEEPLVLKKNLENIESLIIVFKGLAETQEVIENDENEEEQEDEDEEEKDDVTIIEDDNSNIKEENNNEKIEEIIIEDKPKSKGKGKGKVATTAKKTKKTTKADKKSKTTVKKEEPIEIEDDKPAKKGRKKRKAEVEVEPIEIKEDEEPEIEVIESPKKKRKISTAKATKKNTTKGKAKVKKEEEAEAANEAVIVINESDEEKPKVAKKNIKKNNKKTKKTKDKDMTSESSLKSKNKNNKNIKDKKIKASKSKEEDCQIEPLELKSDDVISTKVDLSPIKISKSTSQSSISKTLTAPLIEEDITTFTSTKSKPKVQSKTKTKNKSKKSTNKTSSSIVDLAESTFDQSISKTIKKSNKKRKLSKKEKKINQEKEDFVNKILRETNLIGGKSSNTTIITSPHPIATEKTPEKIKIESLITNSSTYTPLKGPRGVKRTRAIDFF